MASASRRSFTPRQFVLDSFTDTCIIRGMSTVVKNILSVAEAAAEIGCTEGRVRQLLREGVIDVVHLNERAWAVHRASVEAFCKQPQVTGRPRVSSLKHHFRIS